VWKFLFGIGGVMLEVAAPFLFPNKPYIGYIFAGTGAIFIIAGIYFWWKEKKLKTNKADPSLRSTTTFKATRDQLDKLFLAVVTVRTKTTNYESFDDIKETLIEKFKFLQEHEAIFEGSVYQQEYREFMHASRMAIGNNRNYRDREEMEYWEDIIFKSSKVLEEALR
jgi:hypothetical protein